MEDRNRITRLHTLLVVCLVLFAVLLGRMVYLQLWRGDYYAKQSDGNRLRQSRILAPRGIIYDSEGKELVNNLPGYAVVLQKQSSYKPETLQRLSNLLQMPVEEINAKIKASKNFYEPIMLKNNLDQQMVTKIEEQRRYMPEVMLSVQPIRNYPYHELAVHALGYVGEVSSYEIEQGLFKNISQGSLVGKGGLEKTYDKYLRGEDGAFMEEVDVAGNVVKHYDSVQPIPGKNLKLTIDYELQKELEAFTDKHLAFLRSSGIAPGARAAAVVAIDPRNGAVRAMVSRPGYDPNWFVHGISSKNWNSINNDPNYPMNNKVITGEYPPGSTFKIVSTYAPALNEKGMSLATTFEDEPYEYPDGSPVNNATRSYNGTTTIRTAIQNSINVVAVKCLEKVTPELGLKYLDNFGFTTLAHGTEADKDANGNVWSDANLATALGGITRGVTNVELCASYAAIANDGNYIRPIYYTKILDHNGNVLIENTAAERSVIKESTAFLLTSAMEDVVKQGTGTACQLDNMPVAGKTGTTEAYNDLWFVGYTPYYTCAVWSGYDNNEKLPDYARNFHKALWKKVMTRIHEGLPSKEFEKPASVEKLSVCEETGLLPRAGCPVITEYFDVGTMPTEYCDQHFYDSDDYDYDYNYDTDSSDQTDNTTDTDNSENSDNGDTDNSGDSNNTDDNGNSGDDGTDNTGGSDDNGDGNEDDSSYQVDYY